MLNSQLIFILVLATIAGLILFRLYTVLGRRTGNERPPQQRFESLGTANAPKADAAKPALLPDRGGQTAEASVPGNVERGLLDIKLADRTFEAGKFLEGAKRAYETIVAAFAKGDREALRPLLSEDVYQAFEAVLADRETRKEKVDFTFVGFGEVKIMEASMSGQLATVTVSFGAQFISATLDAEGNLLHGDAKLVRSVTDIWTFERNVRASDPNWRLVATSGEADLQDS